MDFGRFVNPVEQSLNDQFVALFCCLIFCPSFVQICVPGIRLKSNKKIGTFTKTAFFAANTLGVQKAS